MCFDSYNDKRTGFEFDLTAGGAKIDLILGNGENEWDTSWNAVWDGEVAHDDRGWTAEFRVPLSQLRYGPQDIPAFHISRRIRQLASAPPVGTREQDLLLAAAGLGV